MNEKNNASAIIMMAITVAVVGILVWGASRNEDGQLTVIGTPTVDMHGHPLSTDTSATSLNELIGKPAPDFALADSSGKVYSLNGLRGKNIVMFFNEGVMCYPSCWDQMVTFARDDRLNQEDTIVLSVVVDSPEEWQEAIRQMPELAEAVVVFDDDTEVSRQFGMLVTESSMHKGLFPGHSYVVIDKEGIVRYVLDDPSMRINNDKLIAELGKLT
ncbi:MAG: redoxin domain-containing protein [Patescibacteria group bacterium]|nr:redoxin domain-containing protein [Patescibacteria group bacterium]